MRRVQSIALVIVVTLFARSTALPATKHVKVMGNDGVSTVNVESIYTDHGRRLRRVEKYNVDDNEREERGFGDIKSTLSKLNPVKAVKKIGESPIQKFAREAREEFKAIEKAKKMVGMNK